MTTAMPPLTLYRALIRQGKLFQDYNFRSYALRRIKTGFQRQKHLQGYAHVVCHV